MTKRPHFTVEEVLENVLSDDEDMDDVDEPIMEGSDDEFSDFDVSDIDDSEEDSPMDAASYDPTLQDNPLYFIDQGLPVYYSILSWIIKINKQ